LKTHKKRYGARYFNHKLANVSLILLPEKVSSSCLYIFILSLYLLLTVQFRPFAVTFVWFTAGPCLLFFLS